MTVTAPAPPAREVAAGWTNATVQRIAAFGGPCAMIMFLVGFITAGFLVPPQPTRSTAATVEFLTSHAGAIKFGLLVCCLSGGIYVLFSIPLSIHIRRIEGPSAVLAVFQICMAALTGFIVIFPCYFWFYATYRPRDPDTMVLLNDMGWLTFAGFIWTIFWQYVAVAAAVFLDRRPEPIFPRWYGYFTVSAAVGVLPAGLNVYFLDGPLAWNGTVAWWLEVTMIATWSYTTFFVLLKVIKRQEAEA
jgi:hypothetical protein